MLNMELIFLRKALSILKKEGVPSEQIPQLLRTALLARFRGEDLTNNPRFKALLPLFSAYHFGREGSPEALTPHLFALLRETQNNTSTRKGKGIFFTPPELAQKLALEALQNALQVFGLTEEQSRSLLSDTDTAPRLFASDISFARKTDHFLKHITFCDPAAGSGSLILPLWKLIAQARTRLAFWMKQTPNYPLLLREILNNIYAGDIDKDSLEDIRLRIHLELFSHGIKEPPVLHLFELDALEETNGQSLWKKLCPDIFRAGGFDIILSNPPYIGQKNNKAIFEKLRKNTLWGKFFSPKSDLLYFFFPLALDLLKNNGTAGFITTSYWTTATGAGKIRRFLFQESAWKRLIDYGEKRLFGQAQGQHNLLSVFQKTTNKQLPCQLGESRLSQKDLYYGKDFYILTQNPTERYPFSLKTALEKMARSAHLLGEEALISNGLMTGCDSVKKAHLMKFPSINAKIGDGIFILSERELQTLRLTDFEKTKIKPFFKNSDIYSYTVRTKANKFLIDLFYPKDRDIPCQKIPNFLRHLSRFKPILLARKQNNNGIDKQLQKGIYWFASVRRKMDFEAPKLITPQRAAFNTFAYNEGEWYASSDVYFVSDPKNYSLWFLLGLLNSAPCYAWLFFHGKRKGTLLEFYSQPLSQIPLPDYRAKEFEQVTSLAKSIFTQKQLTPQADISQEQQEIDLILCGLWGMNDTETQQILNFARSARRKIKSYN